jgi:hypothetical protein
MRKLNAILLPAIMVAALLYAHAPVPAPAAGSGSAALPIAPAAHAPAAGSGSAALPIAPAAGSGEAALPIAPAAGSAALPIAPAAGSAALPNSTTYLGFDRNDYPGDADLRALRKTFAFTGYWLNNPPGENANSWLSKRAILQREGFGFLLLFNGRTYAELKGLDNPGAFDGAAAARIARAEGFHQGAVIFLDQEEGGRMFDEQKKYVLAWADAVKQAGYRAGVYCSGIETAEKQGGTISTARDLHDSAPASGLVFWVANDACPPSPGCGFSRTPPPPAASGAPFAAVWQFAQSPLRKEFAAACAQSYSSDGNCYAPGTSASSPKLHLDVNTALVPDPSHGRQ